MPEPNDFTVVELKEIARARKLSSAGSKGELIARLMEYDPEGTWMNNDESENAQYEDSRSEREIEMYRREKELAERELQLARREIAMLRGNGYVREENQAHLEENVAAAVAPA